MFDARKILKDVNEKMKYERPNEIEPGTEDDYEPLETITLSRKIHMNEDLSGARLKLAFEARQLKRAGKITDTWVIDGKIKIKDLNNVILTAGSLTDLVKYGYVPTPRQLRKSGQTNNRTQTSGQPSGGGG